MKNVFFPTLRIVSISLLLGLAACDKHDETAICGQYSYDGNTEIFETGYTKTDINRYKPSGKEDRFVSITLYPLDQENIMQRFASGHYSSSLYSPYLIAFQINENLIGVPNVKVGGIGGKCSFTCFLPTVVISCLPYVENLSTDITEYGFVTIDRQGAEYRVDFKLTVFEKELKGWYQGTPHTKQGLIAILNDPS